MTTLTQSEIKSSPSSPVHRTARFNRAEFVRNALIYLIIVIAAVAFMIPILWLVLSSIKTDAEFAAYPIRVFPRIAMWSNYAEAIDKLDFIQSAWNTFLLALIYTVLNVISCAFSGYGFARHTAPGRNLLFTLMLSTMMVPAVVMVIPQFVLYTRIGLVGTILPWVLWGMAGNPFQIFLFKQFFAGFPKELEDAAEVDGCTPLRTFFQIFLPNAGPVIAASAIFSFQW
ncbi:MAG: carbohydrate ABC transporter permease, partial [Chitinophagaceae bacterium]|nr:carbohydrate ABC transporter permease [Anaerolineae bacterium]